MPPRKDYFATAKPIIKGLFPVGAESPEFEERIREIATEIYNELGTQYGVAKVPAHDHDNISTNSFPVSNLEGYYKQIVTETGLTVGNTVLDLGSTNVFTVQMPAGNITISVMGVRPSQCFIVNITQDSGGSRLVTWFSGISWVGGSTPTLTTTANKTDTFGFIITSLTTFQGYIVGQNI